MVDTSWYKVCNSGSKWHYVTTKKIVFDTPAYLGVFSAQATKYKNCSYTSNGKLLIKSEGNTVTIMPGYAFDGATFAPDFKGCMSGVVLHDALYQIRKCSDRLTSYSFKDADQCFLYEMKRAGFSWFMRNIYWAAVRSFGWVVSCQDEDPKGLYVSLSR